MHNLVYKLFHAERIKPPRLVRQALEAAFGGSINVEWHQQQGLYEALFYVDNMEHIALISPEGLISETKRNLNLSQAKPEITRRVEQTGEMMNLIEINREGVVYYEVIARDHALDRYFILLDEHGTELEKRKL